MQPNTLTLNVDVLNNAITVAEPFTRFDEYQNRAVYIGVNHLPETRNTLSIYRTFPTKNGNYKGTAKSSVKFTQDVGVAGVDGVSTLTAPIILDLSFSIPVGATAADVLHLRQRLIAALDDDTFMDSLNIQQMI